MDFEVINKLFLELSQVTTATTSKEIKLLEALREANDLLRSTYSIAERKGESTNWDGFSKNVLRALEKQHRLLYPSKYNGKSAELVEATKEVRY